MHDERKLRGKASKSFARRIIKVWIFGVLVPLLVVESLILWQFYRINHNDVDEEIENNLNKVSVDMKDLMNNMNSISWLLEADGTVGKNLHLYFDEEDTIKKLFYRILLIKIKMKVLPDSTVGFQEPGYGIHVVHEILHIDGYFVQIIFYFFIHIIVVDSVKLPQNQRFHHKKRNQHSKNPDLDYTSGERF